MLTDNEVVLDREVVLESMKSPMEEEEKPLRSCTDILSHTTPRDIITTSNPSSPGLQNAFRSASPETTAIKDSEILPPPRPKSTPFPIQEDDVEIPSGRIMSGYEQDALSTEALELCWLTAEPSSCTNFLDMPTEIHEVILDHLLGVRSSTNPKASPSRGWSHALRHSRRRELSDLALVNKEYRILVQGRLFKHIKVKGTRPSITDALDFFITRPHLQTHPRHIEIWRPLWEIRSGQSPMTDHITFPPTTPADRHTLIRTYDGTPGGLETTSNLTTCYRSSSENSTLYEIFRFVQLVLPQACVLTLEGGDCKKPPMMKHFPEASVTVLPALPQIRTLIFKSAWNIMRTTEDFQFIMAAMPNLIEWEISYAKAKSKSYLSKLDRCGGRTGALTNSDISQVVRQLPVSITRLNLLLEPNYSREMHSPRFWKKVYPEHCHICFDMAKFMPQMEKFVYCGRICHHFFSQITRHTDPASRGNTKTKTIDLTVKNCCRSKDVLDGTGIMDIQFITEFETLVTAAIRSLEHLTAVAYLRIRFIDLESPMPLLNPFFQMRGNECTGLWSQKVLAALAKSRPTAKYLELSDDFCGIKYDKEYKLVPGSTYPRGRPLSMMVESYMELSNEIMIT